MSINNNLFLFQWNICRRCSVYWHLIQFRTFKMELNNNFFVNNHRPNRFSNLSEKTRALIIGLCQNFNEREVAEMIDCQVKTVRHWKKNSKKIIWKVSTTTARTTSGPERLLWRRTFLWSKKVIEIHFSALVRLCKILTFQYLNELLREDWTRFVVFFPKAIVMNRGIYFYYENDSSIKSIYYIFLTTTKILLWKISFHLQQKVYSYFHNFFNVTKKKKLNSWVLTSRFRNGNLQAMISNWFFWIKYSNCALGCELMM